MKELLDMLLNNRKKPKKVIGTIVSSPSYLKYVISTDVGKMQVESTVPYKITDRVVVYDNLIQGYAGAERQKKILLV
jgi:hypothetical protein